MSWLLLWLGCGPSCPDTCPLGTACESGECVARECATSAQCPLGRHCSRDGECAEGCLSGADCPVGSVCDDSSTCVRAACVNTATDCSWREVCRTGQCVDAGEPYCSACTRDGQCGGEGNLCFAGEWCGVACGEGGSCPAGFACTHVDHTDGHGYEVCLSACWLAGVQ